MASKRAIRSLPEWRPAALEQRKTPAPSSVSRAGAGSCKLGCASDKRKVVQH